MKMLKTNSNSLLLRSLLLFSMAVAGLQACSKDAAEPTPAPIQNTPAPEPEPEPEPEPDPQGTVTIKISSSPALGDFLVDKNGKTLYLFSKDVDGKSDCAGGCLDNWPFFFTADLVLGPGLDAKDFGVITRADGDQQTTFKGWPLYRFAQDAVAGATKGDGTGSTWFVANPNYTLFVADKNSEKFLVDDKGRTLYTSINDKDNVSNCNGNCTQARPLFFSADIVVPSLLKKTDFGSITRNDNLDQTTFLKKALYFFAGDAVRGDVKGKNVDGFKLVPLAVKN